MHGATLRHLPRALQRPTRVAVLAHVLLRVLEEHLCTLQSLCLYCIRRKDYSLPGMQKGIAIAQRGRRGAAPEKLLGASSQRHDAQTRGADGGAASQRHFHVFERRLGGLFARIAVGQSRSYFGMYTHGEESLLRPPASIDCNAQWRLCKHQLLLHYM